MSHISDQDIARLDGEILQFMEQRAARLGEVGGGLEGYYGFRILRRYGVSRYERYFLKLLENERRVYHAGIGLGVLMLGLARAGVECVGFEVDRKRYAAASAMRQALAKSDLYDIRQANYPEGLTPSDATGDAVLMFTNVGSGWPEDQLDAVIDSMHRFSTVYLDLRLFGSVRESHVERDQLASHIASCGFGIEPVATGLSEVFYVKATSQGGGY